MNLATRDGLGDFERAQSLPSMGGREIGETLMRLAADIPEPGQAIVEVGCWLGSGTAHLAIGARQSGAPIHVYDRWTATGAEVEKAARFGVTLEKGGDTLPRVRENLEPFGSDITYHKGNLRHATWHGQPIGLYVDDASKQPDSWRHVTRTFLPHIPVGGFLVLMDFYFFEKAGPQYKAQWRWMVGQKERFKCWGDHVEGTTAAIFERVA